MTDNFCWMFSNLFRITFTPALYSHKQHFYLELQQRGLWYQPHLPVSASPQPIKHHNQHIARNILLNHIRITHEKNSMKYTCFGGIGSCITGSRVMNFLSFTMLRTSYKTHISVKALLKLFLTESQGQRDG